MPIIANTSQAIAWAIGPLNQRLEVSYHTYFSKQTKLIQFGREPQWNCPLSENDVKMMEAESEEEEEENYGHANHNNNHHSQESNTHNENYESETDRREQQSVQTVPARAPPIVRNKHWEIPPIECDEPDDGVFYAQLGPTGGKQGYPAITGLFTCAILLYLTIIFFDCYFIYFNLLMEKNPSTK